MKEKKGRGGLLSDGLIKCEQIHQTGISQVSRPSGKFFNVLAVFQQLCRVITCALITHTQRASPPGALLKHGRICHCLRPAWQ